MSFDINKNSIKKAKEKIERVNHLKLCLKTKTCPTCAEDLDVIIDSNGNKEYRCTDILCGFVYP